MKSIAFAPGHISGFFEPIYNRQDLSRTGSRGAGMNISFGAISEVTVEKSTKQIFEIFINGQQSDDPVIELALKYLIGNEPLKIIVNTKMELPVGQGFGMSAAGALSASMALSKILSFSRADAVKASHFAEVQLKTGLSDVLASSFGGIEVRKEAGLPPWGIIEHIPGKYEVVLCVIGEKIDTKKILSDPAKLSNIATYGRYCTKKLLENPSIENFFSLSETFAKKTGLADRRILDAVESIKKFGMGSMCMLGNSVFAFGDTKKLYKTLSKFGKTFVCNTDEKGARILD